MEKKTIGSFIAALRRANGMTQRELAEKLYVSDKTVSRWECDESAPELSLIPVIADIFGVTTDELLKGERKSPNVDEPVTDGSAHDRSERSEKSFKILLRKRLDSFKMQSWISLGLAFLGLLIAMVCNFGFLSAIIGFCIGSCFIVAAVICQICFINLKYFRNDDEIYCDHVNLFNYRVYKLSRRVFIVILTVFGFILPFLIEHAYVGLSSESWLLLGCCISAVLTLFAIIFSDTFVFKKLSNNGIIAPQSKDTDLCTARIQYLKKRSPLCVGIAVLLGVAIGIVTNLPHTIAKPIVFDSYESFKEYIETPTNRYELDGDTVIELAPSYDFSYSITDNIDGNSPSFNYSYDSSTSDKVEVYPSYDFSFETIPSDKYFETEEFIGEIEVTDEAGNVLFSYRPKNKNVARYTFSNTTNKLPIKVYTYESWNNATETCSIICLILSLGIIADLAAFFIVYFVKIKKNQ